MDSVLRPQVLNLEPSAQDAAKTWKHWHRTFTNFLEAVEAANENAPNKLNTLINYVSANVYDYIADASTYEEAITILQGLYVSPLPTEPEQHKEQAKECERRQDAYPGTRKVNYMTDAMFG